MEADVLVIGAGTAGAAAARACAKKGLRTLCLERGPLDQAGARWINGVPGWAFDVAGMARPEAPELRGHGGLFHMVAGWGPTRVSIADSEVLEVDMRLLVARLQEDARRFGADLVGERPVLGIDERPDEVRVETEAGTLRVRTVVDATGLSGLNLLVGPATPRTLICTAAQQVHALGDVQQARAWLSDNDAQDGDVLCFTGVSGGYSIVNVRVHEHSPDGPEVSLLTGSIPARGNRAGQPLLDDFVAAHSWVGELRFGGARAIPVAGPHAVLGRGRIAGIGDTVSQVFSAHGSGIGAQLVAAELLASTLADGQAPFDYSVAWHRAYGGRFAASAVFAAFSRDVSVDELTELVDSGVLGASLVASNLAQRPAAPPLRELPDMARGAWRARDPIRRFLPILRRMFRVQAHHRTYPRDPARVPQWEEQQRRWMFHD